MADFINSKYNLSHAICQAIFDDYFSIYDTRLDAHQYEAIMEQLYNTETPDLKKHLSIFNKFDENHDGYISIDELTVQFTLYKERTNLYFPAGSDYTVNYIIEHFDLNKDRKLSFLDFNHCLSEVTKDINGWMSLIHYAYLLKKLYNKWTKTCNLLFLMLKYFKNILWL